MTFNHIAIERLTVNFYPSDSLYFKTYSADRKNLSSKEMFEEINAALNGDKYNYCIIGAITDKFNGWVGYSQKIDGVIVHNIEAGVRFLGEEYTNHE